MDDVSDAVSGSSGARCRPATIDDEPFLWTALLHAIYVPPGAEPPPADVVHRPELARYVTGWSRDDLGVIAETSDATPVGAAWLRLLSGDGAGYGHVADDVPELAVAVLPDWRGRGIGTAMLQQLLGLARGRHAHISLSVNRANPAHRLYRRLRFREVASGGGTTIMLLDLGP